MRLSFAHERVLAVVAHPDDAELLCAGTLARAKTDKAEIGILILCKGDKGQSDKAVGNLSAIRKKESQAAASLLEAGLWFGGFSDGTLMDGESTRAKIVELFRQFRPTLVLAHSPADYHPDHRSASHLSEAASWFCASRGHQTKSPALESPPALWWMDTVGMQGFQPGFFVDISSHVALKHSLLNCHATQLARGSDGDFSPLGDLMQQQYQTRGQQANTAAAEAFQQHLAFKRTYAW